LSVSGGIPPYTFTLSTGFLPAGVTLTASGAITGSPTVAGSFLFDVKVADSTGCSTIRNYTLVVDGTAQCPTSVPTLTVPAEATSIPVGAITLAWTAVSTALTYEVFAGFDGRTPLSIGSTGGTSLTFTISDAVQVEWFVRAAAPGCSALESAHAHFKTVRQCNAGVPALLQPANGTTVTLPVTFSWSAVIGAVGYKLFVLSPSNPTATLIGSTTTTTGLITSSIPTGTLQWFVQALFDNCPSTESVHNTFTVASIATCPTASATLLLPVNGIADVISPVIFSWTSVNSATTYRLLVSLNGGAPTAIAITPNTQFSASFPDGATDDWSVEALFANCPATQSPTFHFSTRRTSTCSSQAPTLFAPLNGASVISPVSLQWGAVTGATGYNVYVSVNSATPLLLGSSSGTQLTADLPQGSISWQVEALFPGCPSTISGRATFTVTTGSACRGIPATLVSPTNGATGIKSPVPFIWSAVPGASNYNLFVSLNATTFDLVGSTSATTLTRIIPAGTVQWFVETQFVGCSAQRSSTFTLTVIPDVTCPTGMLTLLAPPSGVTIASPVTFTWNPLAGTSEYRLWLSIDGSAPATIARTSSATVTTPVPSGSAEWFVEALAGQCPSILSSHGRFTVQPLTTCNTNLPVTLVAPPASADVTGSVDFTWSATPGASGYRVWASVDGQPFSDFGITADTHLKRDLPPGNYQWYVDAVFPSCPPVPSARSSFRVRDLVPICNNDTPSTIFPGDGATVPVSPIT